MQKSFLESLFHRYHRPEWIGNDPLRWARFYEGRGDREVAAFLAAALAYGNVVQINRSLENLFSRMGSSPAKFAREFIPGKSDEAIKGFYHRFNTDRDLSALIHLLGQMLRKFGSIEGFWAEAQAKGEREESIAVRAGRFVDTALELDLGPYAGAEGNGGKGAFFYLMPKAAGTSACKRLNMFLRWVVRPDDGIDLGLWSVEKAADLEYPVDTHIHRIARYLGVTKRKSADAQARREITSFFRRFSPEDPVRYDFSLCRLGILKQCPRRQEVEICEQCELRPGCLRNRRMARAAAREPLNRLEGTSV